MKILLRKIENLLLIVLIALSSNGINSQTFTNSTANAYGTWNSSYAWATALNKTIAVSGLPATLSTSGIVLKQVNLKLGDGLSHGGINLTTLGVRLISPNNDTIRIINVGGFSCTSITDVDIAYRDDAILDFPNSNAHDPFNIGYYRVATANSFSTVNGKNPNGNWKIQIVENLGSGSEIAFVKVDLVFGTPLTYNDITGTTSNNACSAAQCLSGAIITKATISGYTGTASTDPNVGTPYPGGCQWNAAKNNTGWFYFKANSSSATISISGVSNIIQSIVVKDLNHCVAGSQTLPTGGCPTDTGNDTYESKQYTGAAGASTNQQFKLSGLTINEDYYLVIDGNGGAISSLYIETVGNTASCTISLPIGLLNFDGRNGNSLYWNTSSEINNDYFILERSLDGQDWTFVNNVSGRGASNEEVNYEALDINYTRNAINYYRLSQVDYNGDKKVYNELIKAIDNRPEKDKKVVRVTNMLGQEVDFNASGILILIYSDGTIKRILN